MPEGKHGRSGIKLYAPVILVGGIIISEFYEYYFIFVPVYFISFNLSVRWFNQSIKRS